MTAKEYLGQVKKTNELVNSRLRTLYELRQCAGLLKAVNVSGNKIRGGGVSDPLKVIDKITDLETEINRDIDRLTDIKKEVLESINRVLLPEYIAILTDRYVNCMTLERIAEEYEVSYRTVCVRLGQALQIFRTENNMT